MPMPQAITRPATAMPPPSAVPAAAATKPPAASASSAMLIAILRGDRPAPVVPSSRSTRSRR